MQSRRQYGRVDTQELKSQLIKKLGRQHADKYFHSLKKFLSSKLTKPDFDKLCISLLGKENIKLHNSLVRAVLGNACLSLHPPSKQTPTGDSRTSKLSSGPVGDAIPLSPKKGRLITSRDRKFADRPSPLGPHHGKPPPPSHVMETSNSCDVMRSREQRSGLEFVSIGSKAPLEVISVEDGEEVEQVRSSPACVQSRSPIRPPLGIVRIAGGHKMLEGAASSRPSTSYSDGSCTTFGGLLDTQSLSKQIGKKLEAEGLGMSMECANLLNAGLDAHLKRFLGPILSLAKARHYSKGKAGKSGFNMGSNQYYGASFQDIQVVAESNPEVLGCISPAKYQKITFRHLDK